MMNESRSVLIVHPDPSVRERAAAILDEAGVPAVGVDDIPGNGEGAAHPNGSGGGGILAEPDLLETAIREQLTLRELSDLYTARILDRVNGNKVRAARILGINRRTLYRRGEARRRDAARAAGEND